MLHLLQQRKLALGCALAELMKVDKNLPRMHQNVNTCAREEEPNLLQGDIGHVASKLSLLNKTPFRKVPAVEAWLAQYQHNVFRYRLLVPEGPSGLGKTLLSAGLSPRCLEVTCFHCEELYLRDYKSLCATWYCFHCAELVRGPSGSVQAIYAARDTMTTTKLIQHIE